MEAKHTPGPWRTSADCAVLDADGRRVADIYFDTITRNGDTEAQANAALIAAAPDMLEALRAMLSMCEPKAYPTPKEIADRMNAARAAIAKAEGK